MIKKYKKWLGQNSPEAETPSLDTIQLIEGTFNAIDAADVLLSLVTYKIKFHNLQLLHPSGGQSISREQSEKRIAELKQAKNKITQIIRQARDEGSHLEITSDIKIHKITAKEHLPRNPETT